MLPEELRLKKAHQVQSNVKVLLTVFFYFNSIVYHEFLQPGHTDNKEYYLTGTGIVYFYAICVKQFEENARICGKTTHGACTTIMHLLTIHCLFVNFWPKTTPLWCLMHYDPDSMETVSYTHLDVYKRQEMDQVHRSWGRLRREMMLLDILFSQ